MILSFSSHGKGQGQGPVKYVCDEKKPDGTTRAVKPEVLRGDPSEIIALIDSNKNSYKYTSLVISFTKEEFDELLLNEVLDDFEAFAFAGLDKNDYSYLAVLHKDTDNPHIHIIVPRKNLRTDTDLNIAPKQQQKQWHLWSDYTREKHNLKPVDAQRIDKSPLSKQEKKALFHGKDFTHTTAKIELDKFIKENVSNGLVNSRQDIVTILKSIEAIEDITLKNSSLSVKIKGIDKNIRLSGGIYESRTSKNFDKRIFENTRTNRNETSSNRHFDKSASIKATTTKQQSQRDYRRANGTLEARYKEACRARANENGKRYKTANNKDNKNLSVIFSHIEKKTLSSELRNTREQSNIANRVDSSNIQKLSIETTETIEKQIASLNDKLHDPNLSAADRADIINSLSNLLNIEAEQKSRRLKM